MKLKLRYNKLWYNFIHYNYKQYCDDYADLYETTLPKYKSYFKKHFIHPYTICDNYDYIHYLNFLNETLKTHNIKAFINKLFNKCMSIRDYYFNNNDNNELIDAVYIICYDDSEELEIKQICQLYGYYIAEKSIEDKFICYLIEATYGYTNKTNYVYNKCNGILYHITSVSKAAKILKYGLIPKHLDKKVTHPGRIYCSTNKDIEELNFLGKQLYPNIRYVILKIDLNKFSEKLTFWQDPAYANYGVFTCENIPPYCIEVFSK